MRGFHISTVIFMLMYYRISFTKVYIQTSGGANLKYIESFLVLPDIFHFLLIGIFNLECKSEITGQRWVYNCSTSYFHRGTNV